MADTELTDAYPKRSSIVKGRNDSVTDAGEKKRKSLTSTHSIIKQRDNKDYSTEFDYVIVFPMVGEGKKEQSKYAKHCIHNMLVAGLEVFPYLSVQSDELLVLIRCPDDVLKAFADKIDFKLQFDPAFLEETLKAGDPEKRISPCNIRHDPEITPYTPYEYVFLKYGQPIDQRLYYVPPGETSPFIKSVRLKVINLMLKAPKRQGGCDLEISKLRHKKHILCMYPLHDRSISDQILERCTDRSSWPWDVPTFDIKEYFGEKIALFYVFIGHYSYWLIIPSIVGLAFQLVVWGTLNFSHPVLPFFGVVVTVWSIFMLEYWKRTENRTALQWGMIGFEDEELDRPEFKGTLINSYINGKDMIYFPSSESDSRVALSQSIVLTFIMIVIGVVAAIYVLRFSLQPDIGSNASTVASVLNTVQITLFNMIYQVIAVKLTDRENHRTDTNYEDSLIVKLFVFQFINSYSSFFFLAFIAANLQKPDGLSATGEEADYQGQCGYKNCMYPLSLNLAIIFGTRLTVTNFLDIFLPWLAHKQKFKRETKGVDPSKLTPAENDYLLQEYDPLIQGISNYADTTIQYGFSLLFVTALPCAPFFSLVSSYAKVKFNAWKLCTFFQRPVPSGVQDIGTWQSIFNIISVVAVVTNGALICFTMDVLDKYSFQGRLWIFIGFQWVLISVQFIATLLVEDEPEEVQIQKKRIAWINDKVIEKVEDEDFGETENVGEVVNEEDGPGANTGANGGCLPCFRVKSQSRNRKISEHAPEVPVQSYPFTHVPSQWPKPLDKNSAKAAHAGQTEGTDYSKFNTVYTDTRAPEVVTTSANPVSYY